MTQAEFLKLLQDELAINESDISLDSSYRELRNWSSLNALLIVSKIHEETGILISPVTMASAITVRDLYTALISK